MIYTIKPVAFFIFRCWLWENSWEDHNAFREKGLPEGQG